MLAGTFLEIRTKLDAVFHSPGRRLACYHGSRDEQVGRLVLVSCR